MESIVLLGGGGHARVVLDTLRESGRDPIGYIEPTGLGERFKGLECMGDDSFLLNRGSEGIVLANGIGGTGDTSLRRQVFEKFKWYGFSFVTVIHPSAILAADVTLGEGSQVMAGAVLQTGTAIGANVIVNTSASVDHDSQIGDHCHIAPGAILCGEIQVGADSHIGIGAVIVQGAAVARGSFVRAGAVISK